MRGEEPSNKKLTPFPIMVANGALHCGSGRTLGDILAEWLVFAFPAIAVGFGWQWIFSEKMFAVWIVDYLFAYAFGIFFNTSRSLRCEICRLVGVLQPPSRPTGCR